MPLSLRGSSFTNAGTRQRHQFKQKRKLVVGLGLLKSDLALLENRDVKKELQKRYDQALCPSPFLANIVHPRYRGKNLTNDEHGTGMDFAAQQHAAMVPDLVNYKAEASPFQSFMFQQNMLESVKPLQWWKLQADYLKQETL